MTNFDKKYLVAIQYIMKNGTDKDDRTGVGCRSVSDLRIVHDMSEGFPLLTTKQVFYRQLFTELEFFVKGLTDKKWLTDRGCNIWNQWCSPMVKIPKKLQNHHNLDTVFVDKKDPVAISMTHIYFDHIDSIPPGTDPENLVLVNKREYLIRKFKYEARDLGPVYGYQWRTPNKPYFGLGKINKLKSSVATWVMKTFMGYEFKDQLMDVITNLKSDNVSEYRRLVVSGIAPTQQHQQALPPCHNTFQLIKQGRKLTLKFNMRSADMFLGVPFNIASYAALLDIICIETGLIADTLVASLGDAHIYSNHHDALKEQMGNKGHDQLPQVIYGDIADRLSNMFSADYKTFKVIGYQHDGPIKATVAV